MNELCISFHRDHPFVRETESDRDQSRIERSHYLTCGGFGGPRARLESIMGRLPINFNYHVGHTTLLLMKRFALLAVKK